MGEHELQEALRSKAQEAARQAWAAAEATVAARRAELEVEQTALRDAMEQQLVVAAAAVRRSVLAAAELAARQQQLAAESALRERLHSTAVRLLANLGAEQRHRLWQALTAELPLADWQRIRVHPDDLVRARQLFPVAEVTPEATLIGGLIVETADGRIMVDNSLSGRLERLWSELLAPLFAAVYEEVDRDAAGSPAVG
jgi:vacuolar-type H+-ATPase subunit E/Vma4